MPLSSVLHYELFGVHGQHLIELAREALVQELAALPTPRDARVGGRPQAGVVKRDSADQEEETDEEDVVATPGTRMEVRRHRRPS